MAKGDNNKTSGLTPSWQGGSINTDSISAEGLNSGLRNDIGAGLLRGPTQQSYVGMGQGTRDAFANMQAGAQSNLGLLDNAGGLFRETIQKGGLSDLQNEAVNGFRDIANRGGYDDNMLGAMGGLKGTRDLYSDMYTRGAAGNPYLGDIIKQTNDNTYADVMASLGSRGAVGSNLHMNELGGALADNESRLRYQDYNDGFNRQMGALSGLTGVDNSLFGIAQTGAANRANALGNVFSAGQTGQANMANAAGGLAGLYDQYLTPQRISLLGNQAVDADAQGAAAFDPVLNHLANYQGLLSQNAGAPQPEQPFNWRDGAGIGLGLLSAFL